MHFSIFSLFDIFKGIFLKLLSNKRGPKLELGRVLSRKESSGLATIIIARITIASPVIVLFLRDKSVNKFA